MRDMKRSRGVSLYSAKKKKRSLSLNLMAIGKVSFTNVDEFSF